MNESINEQADFTLRTQVSSTAGFVITDTPRSDSAGWSSVAAQTDRDEHICFISQNTSSLSWISSTESQNVTSTSKDVPVDGCQTNSAAKTLKWLIRWQPGFLMTASESNHPEWINKLKGTVIKNIYILDPDSDNALNSWKRLTDVAYWLQGLRSESLVPVQAERGLLGKCVWYFRRLWMCLVDQADLGWYSTCMSRTKTTFVRWMAVKVQRDGETLVLTKRLTDHQHWQTQSWKTRRFRKTSKKKHGFLWDYSQTLRFHSWKQKSQICFYFNVARKHCMINADDNRWTLSFLHH